jgi:hypothetical protein
MYDLGPAGLIGCQSRQPAPDRLDSARWQQTVGIDRSLGYGKQRRVTKTALAHQLAQMRRYLGHGARRHPIQHDRDGSTSVRCSTQKSPWHCVGVARRRGDEEPEIGG